MKNLLAVAACFALFGCVVSDGAHDGPRGKRGGVIIDQGGPAVSGDGKIAVCHKGKKTLTVGASARDAHLGHGDYDGPCR